MTTPHLDDEALSAAFDGEATAAERAHLSTCPACRARLESLAPVARAVGQPVPPPPPEDIDRAVARAVQAAAGAARGGADIPGTPARRRGRWLAPAAGVAAAVLIVAGVAALLGRSSRSESRTTSALAPQATAAGPSFNSPASSPAVTPPGDLGNQSDAAAVAALVRAAVPPGAARSFSPTAANGAGASITGAPPAVVCQGRALAASGLAGDSSAALRYQARLVWRGQPAAVVVFARSGGLTGVIVRIADCSVLARLPL